jgi:hypothetical protein
MKMMKILVLSDNLISYLLLQAPKAHSILLDIVPSA